MKRLLVRLFQLALFVQIIGHGHLHAHTIQATRRHISPEQTTETEHNLAGKVHHQPIQHLKYSSTNAPATEVLVMQDVENDEDEEEKRHLEVYQYRQYASLFDVDADLTNKENRYFSEDIPFRAETRRYILFQVFRI